MIRLISSCCAARPRGSLATSTSSTSAGSSPSSSRGASRSATTTSASISALRPATEMSSGSPGPPPTSTTPGVRSRWCRATMVPSRSPSRISSRTAALRRGSRLPSTATVTPAWRPTAGRPGGGLGGVVRAHAEDPAPFGSSAHRLVDRGVVGGGDDVPRVVQVRVLEAALVPGDLAGGGQPLDGRRHLAATRPRRPRPPRSAGAPAAGPRGRRRPQRPGDRRASARQGTAGTGPRVHHRGGVPRP